VARGSFAGGYSLKDVAGLLSLSEAQVRGFVRSGLLTPARGVRGEQRFGLHDLVLLRTAKALLARVPPRKLHRALARLKEQLPRGRPLTGVRITAAGEELVVRDGGSSWEADSGQRVLDFEVADLAREVAPLARRAAAQALAAAEQVDADGWFELAEDLEPCDLERARDAYRRCLELDPHHVDAHVNLGRLLHEAGQTQAAETHYRMALVLRPQDATAAFNLGVALEDLGRTAEAIPAYERALRADADHADAHFNVARLYERGGRKAAALRHLQAYRRLTRP
jgi:tetratricopeptide (TPR) repeat protein